VAAYLAVLAGGKDIDVPPASVELVTERNDDPQFQDRAVAFISHLVDELKVPHGNIDRVAGVEHGAGGGYVYRASHWL